MKELLEHWVLIVFGVYAIGLEANLLGKSLMDLPSKGWNIELLWPESEWFEHLQFVLLILVLLIISVTFRSFSKTPSFFDFIICVYASYSLVFVFILFELFGWNSILTGGGHSINQGFENIKMLLPFFSTGLVLKIYSSKIKNAQNVLRWTIPFLKVCCLMLLVLFVASVIILGWSWETLLLFGLMVLKCIMFLKITKRIVQHYELYPGRLFPNNRL